MAKFDVGRFANQFNKLEGPMLANRFIVSITPPASLNLGAASEALTFMCEATTLPGISVGTDDRSQPYGYGVIYKMPWGVIFSDITLLFMSDNKGYIHNVFTSWIDKIVNYNTNSVTKINNSKVPFFVSYRDDYVTDVKISALDPKENVIMTYTLKEAFPTLISDIQGSWANNNQIVKIPIRFNFTRWTVSYNKLSIRDIENINNILQDSNKTKEVNQNQIDLVGSYINTNLTPTTGPSPGIEDNAYKNSIINLTDTTFNN